MGLRPTSVGCTSPQIENPSLDSLSLRRRNPTTNGKYIAPFELAAYAALAFRPPRNTLTTF